MKDLHIVIVSWNVRDLLERCLRSLPAACDGLDWECIVVDNDSADGSADMVRETFKDEERIDLITNSINIGFARACNQGAVQHKSRNVLLLNPDTECPAGSLTKMVRLMDERTDIGILGPRVMNPDGTTQPSVRRFPQLADQAVTLLKLQKVLPQLKSLRRYLYVDLDADKSQEVDQVMGACFLVRAACWDKLHGLDQRYFFWFEEVDACKQAKELGWKVWYEPSVQVLHHRGVAVGKTKFLRRQAYFNDSLRKYMLKWHGWLAWAVIAALSPVATMLAAVVGAGQMVGRQKSGRVTIRKVYHKLKLPCYALHRMALTWFLSLTAIAIASAATFHDPILNGAFCVSMAAAVAVAAYARPACGLAVVAAELIIGGFGRMAAVEINGFSLSLRMALMAGFFLGWSLNAIRAKIWRYWRWSEFFIIQVWVFVAGMVALGMVRGYQLSQPFVFQDANAWFFLLYFLPVMDVAHRQTQSFKRLLRGVMLAGVAWNGLMALLTLFVFTHEVGLATGWYAWIRDARIGEITPAPGGLVRVFFQSFIYSVFALLGVAALWIERARKQPLDMVARGIPRKFLDKPRMAIRLMIPGIWVLSAVIIALSWSRSFWLGTGMGLVAVSVSSAYSRRWLPWMALKRIVVGTVAAFVLIVAIVTLPPAKGEWSVKEFFIQRGNASDPAAASRWSLLPVMWDDVKDNPVVGHGLGRALTYKSSDPRVLSEHPDGLQTTYAFEWGWLALWVKFGLFGVFIMGWLLASIAWRMWKSEYDWWFKTAAVASVVALAVIHFFTPYLDHPLGFAWLLALEGALAIKRPNPLWQPDK